MTVPFLSIHPTVVHFVITMILAVACLVLICLRKQVKIDMICVCLFIKCILDVISVILNGQFFNISYWMFVIVTAVSFFAYLLMINSPLEECDYTLIKQSFLVFGLILSLQIFYTLLFSGVSYNDPAFKMFMAIPYGGTNIITAILVPISCLALLGVRHPVPRFGLVIVYFAAIVATRSRGGMMLAGLCFLFILFQSKLLKKKWWLKLIIIVAAAFALVAVLLFNSDPEYIKTLKPEDWIAFASNGRMEIWKDTFSYLNIRNVWFGIGMFPPKHPISSAGLHNVILDALVRGGIFGFINYMALLFFVFQKGIKKYMKNPNPYFIMTVVIFINSLYEVCYFSYKCDCLLWMFVGLSMVGGEEDASSFFTWDSIKNKISALTGRMKKRKIKEN